MRFNLKHLVTFVAVSEDLNFHRAAERLGMAQPAVSRLVQELEASLGVTLLERTTRSVRLTKAGQYLLDESRVILKRLEFAERTAQMLDTGTKGILRIGYTTITGHSLVPDISRVFRTENPEIKLDLCYHSSPEQRDLIIRDEIDVGFLIGSFKSTDIETRLIATHPIVALLPKGHPLCEREELTVADLVKEPLIIGADPEWPTFRRILLEMYQKEGHILQVSQEATSMLGILGLVTAGMGITLFCGLPRFCSGDTIVSRPIRTKSPVMVETHVAWKRSKTNKVMHSFVAASQAVGGHQVWR